ncbi:YrhK family protein [Paenarthrobacter sp. Z7-10]|uniref:YrhK family protein n=1 Tax=Paenarthrobacter sp. Z7-10 TaxID=2787635 RepID=UPI0022A9AE9E|nr:YrhK family protein [Paenarthrobacter sp. Z7-10]MCZ2402225.1 YrhK family protein [Paenarthrobacter sp. Z7-10]
MPLFDPKDHKSPAHARLYATIEVIYTIVDFTAAGLFIAGSIMFFFPSAMTAALWCFLVGSICFALKPTLRLVRQLRYVQLDKIDELAKAEQSG